MLGFGPAITEIMISVWDPADGPLEPDPTGCLTLSGESRTAVVPISQGWRGAVAVACRVDLATRMAQRRVGAPPTDPELDQVLANLATLVAKEVVLLLPGQARLDEPTVLSTEGFRWPVQGHAPVLHQGFRADGLELTVTVHQESAERRARFSA